MKFNRRKRTKLEIVAYVHFNPLYRVVRRSVRKAGRLKAALLYA
jgi:hypothetical protein